MMRKPSKSEGPKKEGKDLPFLEKCLPFMKKWDGLDPQVITRPIK
jgi:hypothetical protein